MQVNDRLVSRRAHPIAFVVALVVVITALLIAGVLASRYVHKSSTSSASAHGPAIALQHQQAPDAAERNDVYSHAMCLNFNNQSPDARDRNVQLSGC